MSVYEYGVYIRRGIVSVCVWCLPLSTGKFKFQTLFSAMEQTSTFETAKVPLLYIEPSMLVTTKQQGNVHSGSFRLIVHINSHIFE